MNESSACSSEALPRTGPARRAAALRVVCAGLVVLAAWPVAAQGPFAVRIDLSEPVQVDEADAATRNHLERVKAFLANEQWDEAVEILWQVPERHGERMLPVSSDRFVNVRDYCHLQLAALPPEALRLYRERVDAQARRWYQDGVQRRDAGALLHVIRHFFCSTWGDDALLALGDLELEAGHVGLARGYWERILPPAYWAQLAPPVVQNNGSPVWLLYPDSDLDRASIRARLLLATIFDGELELARHDLASFQREFAAARGKMGGRDVHYAEYLEALLADRQSWPPARVDRQWPSFGGDFERTKVYPREPQFGPARWQARLPAMPSGETSLAASGRRVAEKRNKLLTYHPAMIDNLVLVNTTDDVRAYDLASGEPVWAASADQPYFYKLPGERALFSDLGRGSGAALGVPRHTLSVRNRRVYARLGSPVTGGRTGELPLVARRSHLVCLDLDDEGSLIWNVSDALEDDPRDRSWAFEGSPVVDADGLYVAMRHSGVRPQQYVACFDPESGRLKWRRLICGAETLAHDQEEITHNLLSLYAGRLYCNTNLGAVAALNARDGEIQWITTYPRALQVDLARRPKHFYRDLTPCVVHHGLVYAAPADSGQLLALEALTGVVAWQATFAEEAVHLLGVIDGMLVASGDKLWFIDAHSGRPVSPPGLPRATCFPEGGSPKGFGRGLLANHKVYWPTADRVFIFDAQTDRQLPTIDLRTQGASGGNLIPAGDALLIATHDRLTLFGGDGK